MSPRFWIGLGIAAVIAVTIHVSEGRAAPPISEPIVAKAPTQVAGFAADPNGGSVV